MPTTIAARTYLQSAKSTRVSKKSCTRSSTPKPRSAISTARSRNRAEGRRPLAADEARDRENLTALKGNDAAKRFVDELNRAEDALQTTRKQTADLEQQKKAARKAQQT